MRFNYLISAIFGFMLIHLWCCHTELDRRYMNHLQSDRLIESAQNEVIMLNTQQNNKLTDYMVELVNMVDKNARNKDN